MWMIYIIHSPRMALKILCASSCQSDHQAINLSSLFLSCTNFTSCHYLAMLQELTLTKQKKQKLPLHVVGVFLFY